MEKSIRLFDLRRGVFCAVPNAEFVVALGNFDGVHAAHHALLLRAVRLAHEQGRYSAAWCFDPPSSAFLAKTPSLLCTSEEKISLFANCGLDFVYLANFPALRSLSPTAFVRNVLQNDSHASHIVCGFHFRFGQNGQGDTTLLQDLMGREHVDVLPPIFAPIEGHPAVISASAIRAAISQGDVSTAARLLGRPYSLSAPIVHGKALGRTLGFPTANQNVPDDKQMPKDGIYVTQVRVGNQIFGGVTNVGQRPTVDDGQSPLNCETHVLGLDHDLYGQTVMVEFLHRLRDECKFESVAELRKAVQNDMVHAKRFLDCRSKGAHSK